MSHPCCGAPEDDRREAAPSRALPGTASLVETLALAASPTFLAMALLTSGLGREPMAMMCGGDGPAWLDGMATMYLLMGTFHAAPWLRRLRSRRSRPA